MRRLFLVLTLVPLLASCGGSGGRGGSDSSTPETPDEVALRNNNIVKQKQCVTCHTIGKQGGTVGPILNQVALRRSDDWLRTWLKDPNAVKPGTRMPNFQFSDAQIEELMALLTKMRRPLDIAGIMARGASLSKTGEALFVEYDCMACHRIGNRGRFIGPDLTWVGTRRPETWEHNWLADPEAFNPQTFMPNFKLDDKQLEALTAYLHAQQGQANAQSRQWEAGVALFLDSPAKDRGEKLYLRLACWSCHGDPLRGGIRRNDNMAPANETPSMRTVLDGRDDASIAQTIRQGRKPPAIDSNKPAPVACPSYEAALQENEMQDLLAYLHTLAPKRSKFKFK